MINIPISAPTNFSPDTEITITKTDVGQVIYSQVIGKDGNPVDLTSASKVELTFSHKTDNSVPDVTIIATKVDSLNGMIYIITNANFTAIGDYSVYVTTFWSSSTDFPNGREITSFKCNPSFITVIEK